MSVDQKRVNAVAESLLGSCSTYEDAGMTEAELDDAEFLRLLDEQVEECDDCGFWVAPEELDDCSRCEDCAMYYDDEEIEEDDE